MLDTLRRIFEHKYFLDGVEMDYPEARQKQWYAKEIRTEMRRGNGEPFPERTINRYNVPGSRECSPDGRVLTAYYQPGDL